MICDEAHTALGEKTSARDPQLHGADLHRHDRDRAADRETGFGCLPGLGGRSAARRRRPARAHRAASLPAHPAGCGCRVGADRGRRLRPGVLAKVLDHGVINQAAASLYRDRFDQTPGIVYAAGVEHAYNLAREFRAAGIKAEAVSGRTPPRQARRDARGLRARRDQRPHQRAAPRRGLELTARDGLHAPRADREPPRLPAADRPHHAHPPAQGGRRRRRLRRPARRRTTSARSRSTASSTPTSTGPAPASRPRRAAASSAARAASSLRRRGSSR